MSETEGNGKSSTCQAGEVCDFVANNPHNGVISFDNILVASFVVFQMMTLEGWTEVSYFLKDSVGSITWLYCLAIVLVGAIMVRAPFQKNVELTFCSLIRIENDVILSI